jgi:hypothetical protein
MNLKPLLQRRQNFGCKETPFSKECKLQFARQAEACTPELGNYQVAITNNIIQEMTCLKKY